MKNQELAIQVSLLIQENEKLIQQFEELTDRIRKYEEKAAIRD